MGSRYQKMLSEVAHPWCWLCGRDGYSPVGWWHAPWHIERAHIVNKPRVEDRRAVVLLCSRCHFVQHGHRPPVEHPPITQANLLWLKAKFDPDWYDREFLQRYNVRRLPPKKLPHLRYRQARKQRQPFCFPS